MQPDTPMTIVIRVATPVTRVQGCQEAQIPFEISYKYLMRFSRCVGVRWKSARSRDIFMGETLYQLRDGRDKRIESSY